MTMKSAGKNPTPTKTKDQGNSSQKKIEKKRLDDELDEELADSFPASDPPSVTQPAPDPGASHRKS